MSVEEEKETAHAFLDQLAGGVDMLPWMQGQRRNQTSEASQSFEMNDVVAAMLNLDGFRLSAIMKSLLSA